MSGLIGVIAPETGRYSMFAASVTELLKPDGAGVKWVYGHDIAENANALVHHMYDRDADWLWLLGDDHVFSPDLLQKLLARRVDIVTPLCLMRTAPYRPVAFASETDEGRRRLNLDDHPDGGLVQVHSVGSGGMLIRREVFDFMAEPWFEAGKLSSVQLGEDLYFCDKAREAGFDIHVDLDAHLGHCATTVVWPVREDDGWTYAFSMLGGFQITMPRHAQAYADQVARGVA